MKTKCARCGQKMTFGEDTVYAVGGQDYCETHGLPEMVFENREIILALKKGLTGLTDTVQQLSIDYKESE